MKGTLAGIGLAHAFLVAFVWGCGRDPSSSLSSDDGVARYTSVPVAVLSYVVEAWIIGGESSRGIGSRLDVRADLNLAVGKGTAERSVTLFLAQGSRVNRVTDLEGTPVPFTSYVGQVKIELTPPLEPGDSRRVRIEYTLISRLDGSGVHIGRREVLALPRVSWLPADHRSTTVGGPRPLRPTPSYSIKLECDAPFQVVTPTIPPDNPLSLPAEFSGNGGGLGGIFFVAGPYLPTEKITRDGIEISLIVRLESLATDRKSWVVKQLAGIVRTMRDLVSDQNPEPIRIVTSNLVELERAQMTFIVGPWLFPSEPNDFTGTTALARATARRFFGERLALIGPGSYWMDGFAEFAAIRSLGQGLGHRETSEELLHNARLIYGKIQGSGFDVPLDRTDETHHSVFRHKGMLVIRQLALELGEDRFRRAMAAAFAAATNGPLLLRELLEVWEESTEVDLDPFFEQWIRGRELPTVRFHRRSGRVVEVTNDGPGRAIFAVQEKELESNEPAVAKTVRLNSGESTVLRASKPKTRIEVDETRTALVNWRETATADDDSGS